MIIASSTAGFLPLHVYEGSALERALDICHAINAFALAEFDLATPDPRKLEDVSLREMLDALAMVEAWNARPRISGETTSISFVPAERLIAAVYTLLHFHIPSADGDSDDDHIPVRFTKRSGGENVTHFLCVGSRLARPDEGDNEAEVAT